MTGMSVFDYTIIVAYILATLLIGVWVGRYIRTGREFFLAGRTLPWWAVGFSLVATDIGGTDLIGVGGAAYRYGIAVGNFEWIGCIPAMIVGAFLFVPHLWKCGVTTIPEFLERRFDVRVRTVVAMSWFLFMACNLGVMLFASAKLMQTLASWPMPLTICLVSALVCCYTLTGGLAAVVYTDVLQALVMIFGCAVVLVVGLWQVGGLEGLQTKVEAAVRARELPAEQRSPAVAVSDLKPVEHFELILPVTTPSPFPWPAILFGLALVTSPAYWIGNQAIVQRTLGCRSEYEAKASYVFGALLKTMFPLLLATPGLIAIAKFPALKDADMAWPMLIGSILPDGGKGVFVAAFLAALMSSIDSYLNSATTIFSNDFYLRFLRPNADERRLLLVGRTITLLLTFWGITFAFLLTGVDSGIYAIFQTLMSFFNGPAFAVLLIGLLWRQATSLGALCGFIAGVSTAVVLFLLNHPSVTELLRLKPLFQIADPFLYYSIWATLMTLGVAALVSFWDTPEPLEKQRLVLGSRLPETAA